MRIPVFCLMVIACLGISTASNAASPAEQELPAAQVTIDDGRLEGRQLPSGTIAFLGIPYAAPPVRELRWRDPQPPKPWAEVFHADRFGPQCMQPQRGLLSNQYSGEERTSEDCLFLNVWTRPQLNKAPVIVYIHGGGFYIGSSSMPLYSGEQLSGEGAVVVNLNYRVGPLGFMSHPELSAESPHKSSGNYGFLDQIAALKWVRRNIDKFGGDPENVTIVGQSAGSMSVLTLQASPLAKGLFHRAVGMSGAQIGSASSMPVLPDGEQEGLKLQSVLHAKSLAELRALPADRIVVPRVSGGPKIGPLQDGYVLPASIDNIFAASKQNDVPLIVGFTRDESFGGFGAIKGLQDFREKAAARFGDRAGYFHKLYPAANDAEARSAARLADRDSTMAMNMDAWARAQSEHGRSPVFSYQFSRPHSYVSGVVISDLDPVTAGSYHTSEVPFWLGTIDSFNLYRKTRDWSSADRTFSRAMMQSLVAFARSGNPQTENLRWPAYDPDKPMLLDLGMTARNAAWPDRRKFEFFRKEESSAMAGGALRD